MISHDRALGSPQRLSLDVHTSTRRKQKTIQVGVGSQTIFSVIAGAKQVMPATGRTSIQVTTCRLPLNRIQLILFLENFSILGTVRADVSSVPKEKCSRKDGAGVYYKLSFDIILLFGLTEIKAQISWKEQVSYITMSCSSSELRPDVCIQDKEHRSVSSTLR